MPGHDDKSDILGWSCEAVARILSHVTGSADKPASTTKAKMGVSTFAASKNMTSLCDTFGNMRV